MVISAAQSKVFVFNGKGVEKGIHNRKMSEDLFLTFLQLLSSHTLSIPNTNKMFSTFSFFMLIAKE